MAACGQLMSAIGTHRNLAVWKCAVALAGKVYAATQALPSEEPFALQQQLRSAALAVPVRIAAACGRRSGADRIRGLERARTALCEMETRAMIAVDQGLLAPQEAALADIAELARMLDEFMHAIARTRLAAHARACGRGDAKGSL
jgi:four helix bundle protein